MWFLCYYYTRDILILKKRAKKPFFTLYNKNLVCLSFGKICQKTKLNFLQQTMNMVIFQYHPTRGYWGCIFVFLHWPPLLPSTVFTLNAMCYFILIMHFKSQESLFEPFTFRYVTSKIQCPCVRLPTI